MSLNKYVKYGLIGLGVTAVVATAITVPVVLINKKANHGHSEQQINNDQFFYLADESRLPKDISERTISLSFEPNTTTEQIKWGELTGKDSNINSYSLSTNLLYRDLIKKKNHQSSTPSGMVLDTAWKIKSTKNPNQELNDAEKEFIFKNIKVDLTVKFKNKRPNNPEYKIQKRTDTLYWYLIELLEQPDDIYMKDLVTKVNEGNQRNDTYFTPYAMNIRVYSLTNVLKTKSNNLSYFINWSNKSGQEKSEPIDYGISKDITFDNKVTPK